MAYKVIWSPESYADLEGIFAYISRDSVAIASQVASRLLDAIDRLAEFPLSGSQVREWKRSPYRHSVVPPYRIICRVENEAILIIAIAHGAMDLKKLMRKRRRK